MLTMRLHLSHSQTMPQQPTVETIRKSATAELVKQTTSRGEVFYGITHDNAGVKEHIIRNDAGVALNLYYALIA